MNRNQQIKREQRTVIFAGHTDVRG